MTGPVPIRQKVLDEAALWIGTPYRHQAGRRQVGCDCLGLVRGIWRAIYGMEPPDPGPYSPDWAESGGPDRLLEAAYTLCGNPLDTGSVRPGDLLVFRWRQGDACKHLGILGPDGRFIHAYSGHGVVWSPLVPQWRRRVAAVFAFPET